jgi:heptosyltransferase III
MIPPQRVLVIATRRIGDVFLATPLIRSIKQKWPSISIDALVFESTAEVLHGNCDIAKVITIRERPTVIQQLYLLFRIARRYDIALSTLPGDRPTLYAWVAGKWRAGLLDSSTKSKWKKYVLSQWVAFDNLDTHTVLMILRLADLLGMPRIHTPRIEWNRDDQTIVHQFLGASVSDNSYAVLHTYPKFNYKMWSLEAWEKLGRWLAQQGIAIVLTGSNDPSELSYLKNIASRLPSGTLSAAGKLTLPQSAYLIKNARIYIGPDTALTHVAAAVGAPTIALFGPSNLVKWGPWPKNYSKNQNPWLRLGSQTVGNVTLLQGRGACVPCMLEGCERNTTSYSDCLQQLPLESVVAVVKKLLNS